MRRSNEPVEPVFVKKEIVELDLFEFPHMFNHALGFFGCQIKAVFPQVAVFKAPRHSRVSLDRAQGPNRPG